jgi:hypothetical protein
LFGLQHLTMDVVKGGPKGEALYLLGPLNEPRWTSRIMSHI